MYLKTIENDDLKSAINKIYNIWFKRYKLYHAKDWDDNLVQRCIHDAEIINKEYEEYPVVGKLIIALYQELDARHRGGYSLAEEQALLNKGFMLNPDSQISMFDKKEACRGGTVKRLM